ncbi:MAG: hypothetical protein Q9181_008031, partial [Wetmoreana brouardii]
MIYRCYLVVDGEINPHPAYYEPNEVVPTDQHKPHVALLRVCKEVGIEAKKILYGQNTWRLVQDSMDIPTRSFWKGFLEQPGPPRIGHVITSFDIRELEVYKVIYPCSKSRWTASCPRAEAYRQQGKAITYLEPQTQFHHLSRIWFWKIDLIEALLQKGVVLGRLTLDFAKCHYFGVVDKRCTKWVIKRCMRWIICSQDCLEATADTRSHRSGRQVKTSAPRKVGIVFHGPGLEVEPICTGLLDEDECNMFRAKGFDGQL